MAKWNLTLHEIVSVTYIVDAETEEEAKKQAGYVCFGDGEILNAEAVEYIIIDAKKDQEF